MDTKTCTMCGLLKPTTDYYADKKQSSGLRPNCKACQSKRSKHTYDTDPAYRARKLAIAAKYQKGQRRDYQIRILTIMKRAGCKDCGETDPLVLDFDHISDKTAGIAIMVRNHYTWEAIEAEIAKCEVRCSNCHRRKTALERNYYDGIDLAAL